MSQDSPTPPNSSAETPTRDSLLGFLDSELTLLSQQQTNNGWTSWALIGAMGALAWMILSQWETKWPTSRLWALAYMTLAMGFSYSQFIIQMLQAKFKTPGSRTRFHLGSGDPKKSRAWMVFILLQDAFFLWLIFWCPTSSFTRAWVGVWLGLAFIMWLLVFIFSYTQYPFEVSSSPSGRALRWLPVVHLVLTTIVVVPIVLLTMDLLSASPNALDLKVGGLFAAIHFLALNALDEGGRRPLIDHLLHIRRELALGGMSPSKAARLIEMEFLGMRVSDLFQESAQDFFGRADSLTKNCKSCISSLEATLASLGQGSNLSTQQQLGLISPVLDSCTRQAGEIHAALTRLLDDYKKIESKSRRLSSSVDARIAMVGILANLHSRLLEADAGYKEVHAKLSELQQIAKTLKTANTA